jgi:acetylornithine deacetylase/succinyl-diaminopimelate desuccinylase-like protein
MPQNQYLFRIAAGVMLIFSIFLSFSSFGQKSENTPADVKYQKLSRDIFKELVEINTTTGKGSTAAAEAMASRLRGAGFEANDIQVTGPDLLHKNLVVRYHGKGTMRPVLFICHLDVVEALQQDWSTDPFSFIEKDGYFYGRGTTDVKCEDADLITNLIRLKQEKFIPDRDIIVALTADEEGGSNNGVNWLLTNCRDLIDAEFGINPDGGGGSLKEGRHMALEVQTSEKIYASFEVTARNKGGHSSLPVKNNAIYELSQGLIRLSQFDFPVRLNETTHNYFEGTALKETGQVKSDILTILQNPSDTEAANRLAASSAYYNAMMRTTCVATMLNAGHAENALPQTASATVNCRMLPDDNVENVLANLKQAIADTLISVICTYSSFVAPLSPLRDDLRIPVEQICESMWPGVKVSPVMSTGATDSKYLRRAGIPSYGISGMFTDMDDVRAHGKDERIGVSDFYQGVEFMYRFIKEISIAVGLSQQQ